MYMILFQGPGIVFAGSLARRATSVTFDITESWLTKKMSIFCSVIDKRAPGQSLQKVGHTAISYTLLAAPALLSSLTPVPCPLSCITLQQQFPSSHPVNQHKIALTVADHRVGRGGWGFGQSWMVEL